MWPFHSTDFHTGTLLLGDFIATSSIEARLWLYAGELLRVPQRDGRPEEADFVNASEELEGCQGRVEQGSVVMVPSTRMFGGLAVTHLFSGVLLWSLPPVRA